MMIRWTIWQLFQVRARQNSYLTWTTETWPDKIQITALALLVPKKSKITALSTVANKVLPSWAKKMLKQSYSDRSWTRVYIRRCPLPQIIATKIFNEKKNSGKQCKETSTLEWRIGISYQLVGLLKMPKQTGAKRPFVSHFHPRIFSTIFPYY